VRSAEIADLEPEVRNFDPLQALDGGVDGLAVYRRLLERAWTVVAHGWVVLEVGHDQAQAVSALLAVDPRVDNGKICVRSDVAGRRRCVAARTLG
jgi:release factor glutamine methyltransferase